MTSLLTTPLLEEDFRPREILLRANRVGPGPRELTLRLGERDLEGQGVDAEEQISLGDACTVLEALLDQVAPHARAHVDAIDRAHVPHVLAPIRQRGDAAPRRPSPRRAPGSRAARRRDTRGRDPRKARRRIEASASFRRAASHRAVARSSARSFRALPAALVESTPDSLCRALDDHIERGHQRQLSAVATSMPPKTAVPRDRRAAEPAPVETTSGTTPRMKASAVMTHRAEAGLRRLARRIE